MLVVYFKEYTKYKIEVSSCVYQVCMKFLYVPTSDLIFFEYKESVEYIHRKKKKKKGGEYKRAKTNSTLFNPIFYQLPGSIVHDGRYARVKFTFFCFRRNLSPRCCKKYRWGVCNCWRWLSVNSAQLGHRVGLTVAFHK